MNYSHTYLAKLNESMYSNDSKRVRVKVKVIKTKKTESGKFEEHSEFRRLSIAYPIETNLENFKKQIVDTLQIDNMNKWQYVDLEGDSCSVTNEQEFDEFKTYYVPQIKACEQFQSIRINIIETKVQEQEQEQAIELKNLEQEQLQAFELKDLERLLEVKAKEKEQQKKKLMIAEIRKEEEEEERRKKEEEERRRKEEDEERKKKMEELRMEKEKRNDELKKKLLEETRRKREEIKRKEEEEGIRRRMEEARLAKQEEIKRQQQIEIEKEKKRLMDQQRKIEEETKRKKEAQLIQNAIEEERKNQHRQRLLNKYKEHIAVIHQMELKASEETLLNLLEEKKGNLRQVVDVLLNR